MATTMKDKLTTLTEQGKLTEGTRVKITNGFNHPGSGHLATIKGNYGPFTLIVEYDDEPGETFSEPCSYSFDIELVEDKEAAGIRPTVGDTVKINILGDLHAGEEGVIVRDDKDYQPFLIRFEDGHEWWYFESMVEKVKEKLLEVGLRVLVEGSDYSVDGRVGTIKEIDEEDVVGMPYFVTFENYWGGLWLRKQDVTPVEEGEEKEEPRPFIDILQEVLDGEHNRCVITAENGEKFVVGRTFGGHGLCEYDNTFIVEAKLSATVLNGTATVSEPE